MLSVDSDRWCNQHHHKNKLRPWHGHDTFEAEIKKESYCYGSNDIKKIISCQFNVSIYWFFDCARIIKIVCFLLIVQFKFNLIGKIFKASCVSSSVSISSQFQFRFSPVTARVCSVSPFSANNDLAYCSFFNTYILLYLLGLPTHPIQHFSLSESYIKYRDQIGFAFKWIVIVICLPIFDVFSLRIFVERRNLRWVKM